jgi:hypothetical protein
MYEVPAAHSRPVCYIDSRFDVSAKFFSMLSQSVLERNIHTLLVIYETRLRRVYIFTIFSSVSYRVAKMLYAFLKLYLALSAIRIDALDHRSLSLLSRVEV